MRCSERQADILERGSVSTEAAAHLAECSQCRFVGRIVGNAGPSVIEALQPGARIAGQFEVEKVLGAGAFGLVLLCRDDRGMRCAMKTPLRERIGEAGAIASFKKEIARWVRLERHPNLVRAYGFVEFLRLPFVAIEYVPSAAPLSERIPGDWRQAVPLAIQIARGMEHAFETAGLVHRDLKPGNVLVADSGHAKVTDFGLATAAHFEPGTGEGGGTLPYMAPERFVAGDGDVRSDVYALGVILFELAAGRRPFPDHRDAAGYARDHLETAPPRLDGVPERLAALVASCLAKDPAARPESWSDVVHALTGISQTNGIAPPADPPPVPTPTIVEDCVNRAITFRALGLHDDAADAAKAALLLDEACFNAWIVLGNARLDAAAPADALAAFRQADRLASSDAERILSLGGMARASAESGATGPARELLDRARDAARTAKNIAALDGISELIVQLDEPVIALETCDAIVAANPRAVVSWNNRAILLRRLGEKSGQVLLLRQALASTDEAVRLNPAYAKAWSNRATILFQLERPEEAVTSADRALRHDPSLRGAYLAKSAALLTLGRRGEAEHCLREGMAARPDDETLRQAWQRYGFEGGLA